MKPLNVLYALLLAFVSISLNAQKATLIQLPTYAKRMAHYKENNNTDKLLQLQQDVDSINRYIIDDFTRNFSYGPVYYFYDTTLDLVKNGQLSKALVDKSGKPIDSKLVRELDKKYIIVQYGQSDHDATQGMCRLLTYYPNMERMELSMRSRAAEKTYYSPKFKIGYRGSALILSKKLSRTSSVWE